MAQKDLIVPEIDSKLWLGSNIYQVRGFVDDHMVLRQWWPTKKCWTYIIKPLTELARYARQAPPAGVKATQKAARAARLAADEAEEKREYARVEALPAYDFGGLWYQDDGEVLEWVAFDRTKFRAAEDRARRDGKRLTEAMRRTLVRHCLTAPFHAKVAEAHARINETTMVVEAQSAEEIEEIILT